MYANQHAPLKPFLASQPLGVVAGNVSMLEPASDGQENVVVVTDIFTKFTQTFPTHDQKSDTIGQCEHFNRILHFYAPCHRKKKCHCPECPQISSVIKSSFYHLKQNPILLPQT